MYYSRIAGNSCPPQGYSSRTLENAHAILVTRSRRRTSGLQVHRVIACGGAKHGYTDCR